VRVLEISVMFETVPEESIPANMAEPDNADCQSFGLPEMCRESRLKSIKEESPSKPDSVVLAN
jgi:hypothetical protein